MKQIPHHLLCDFICHRIVQYSQLEYDNPTRPRYCKGKMFKKLLNGLKEDGVELGLKPFTQISEAKRLFGGLLCAIRMKGLEVTSAVETSRGVMLFFKKHSQL